MHGMAEQAVAVVDSSDRTREWMEEFLRGEGYRTAGAGSIEAVLELAGNQHFDAFLIDMDSSGDGLELCRRIRRLEGYKLTPILCITALDQPGDPQRAFEAGADDFITKPVSLAALDARLKAQLQRTDSVAKLEKSLQMLKSYISPRVATLADEYSETGKTPLPEERLVSICFTDIREFTALSETMDPVKLFSLLSAHLRDQIELVYRYGGYVDKFNGDGLMAVFDGDDMVEQSCLCALHIMELTGEKNPSPEKFPIGIGIHTGPAVIGNIGSPEHLDYSVVGTSVNLAARLCGYALRETIIVSDSVRRAIREGSGLQFLDRREVKVRGVSDPVTIYTLSK